MRDELQKKIMNLMIGENVDLESVQSKLVMILNEYEITAACREIATVVNEDDITRYIRMFLISKRVSGRTERTLKQYSGELWRFFNEVQKSPIEVTSNDIKLYLATKEVRDGVSKTYLKNMSRVISSFYTWMQKEEHVLKNPMDKVEEIKLPKRKKKAFSEEEVELLRFAAGSDLRILCILEILISTWCRVSELSQIKISDFSKEMDSVLVHGKGEKDRLCYINAKARLTLEKYLGERKDENPYLFPKCACNVGDGTVFSSECSRLGGKPSTWWKIPELVSADAHTDAGVVEAWVRKIGKRAGVENAHPHRFRRTGATFALRRGMPIEQVSKILGHESLTTTQIYLDISENELEQAHRKYVM